MQQHQGMMVTLGYNDYFVAQGEPRSSFGRNKTRVVTFRVPHNAAVQIYDYKEKTARYIYLQEALLTSLIFTPQFMVSVK